MSRGYFIIDLSGNIVGLEDKSKLIKANWFKRLLAKISIRYRNSLVSLKPIPLSEDQIPEFGEFKIDIPIDTEITKNDIVNDLFIKKMLSEPNNDRWVITSIE